jgi:hypothetical protein
MLMSRLTKELYGAQWKTVDKIVYSEATNWSQHENKQQGSWPTVDKEPEGLSMIIDYGR